jgi:hypothetical protein
MIDAKQHLNSFLTGLLLTGGATALSSAIAYWGYHNSWYLAALLPVFMALYVLLAWLIHLQAKSTLAVFTLPGKNTIRHPENRLSGDLPEDKASGVEISNLRDENGLVRRRPTFSDKRGGTSGASVSTVATLIWSAVQLAILATALYRFFGVGANYF